MELMAALQSCALRLVAAGAVGCEPEVLVQVLLCPSALQCVPHRAVWGLCAQPHPKASLPEYWYGVQLPSSLKELLLSVLPSSTLVHHLQCAPGFLTCLHPAQCSLSAGNCSEYNTELWCINSG